MGVLRSYDHYTSNAIEEKIEKENDWIISTHTTLALDFDSMLGTIQNPSLNSPNGININRQFTEDDTMHKKILVFFKNQLRISIHRMDVLTNIEKDLDNSSMRFADSMKRMLLRTQSLLDDPSLAGLGLDIIEYALWAAYNAFLFANEMTNMAGKKNLSFFFRQRFLDFDELVRAYIYGLNQRLIGVHFSERDPAQSFSGMHGLGIQRYLRAVNAIPRALHSSFKAFANEDWYGFTVFDYYPNTLILSNRIINMPFSNINDPTEWWGLGHETGHAFCMSAGVAQRPFVKNLVSELSQDPSFSFLGVNPDEFVEELIATVFEYQFCYRRNFELHLRALWDFFNNFLVGRQDSVEKTTEYFTRTVFTFFYHLKQSGGLIAGKSVQDLIRKGKEQQSLYGQPDFDEALIYRTWGEMDSVQDVIVKYIRLPVSQIALQLRYELLKMDLQIIERVILLCESLCDEIEYIFNEYGAPEISSTVLSADRKTIKELLESGKIPDFKDKKLSDLFLIPLALKDLRESTQAPVSDRAKIAAVLSLWHWDRIKTNELWKNKAINLPPSPSQ